MFEFVQTLVHRSRTALANGLMNLIVRLHGDHVTCDSAEDTAELSEDGRSMIINFVFCGTLRTIRLPFNRRNIVSKTFVLRNEQGEEIDMMVSSVPGLDGVVFSQYNLEGIYPDLHEIEELDEFDD